eukprot:scaffold19240_cov77-Isochrysis_galbana.AAC.1
MPSCPLRPSRGIHRPYARRAPGRGAHHRLAPCQAPAARPRRPRVGMARRPRPDVGAVGVQAGAGVKSRVGVNSLLQK